MLCCLCSTVTSIEAYDPSNESTNEQTILHLESALHEWINTEHEESEHKHYYTKMKQNEANKNALQDSE